ncbi:phospholipase A2-like [Penaeus japonicus]|uniref:phospholipase A2-like n=1 Tax=Penaeus japonicus TaxID=27405 RepID=UPI001C714A46|nr:phospholipase A2-like [Penaeus japonicus]
MRGISSLAVTCLVMLASLAAVEGSSRGWISFPGTKWCGPGTRAEHENDLGKAVEVDRCCREHDLCPEKILKGTTRHGLSNKGKFTISHCDCDKAFYECLKKASGKSARVVGYTFFTLWNPPCFKKDFPTRCVEYSVSGRRCVKTKHDNTKPKTWQWFSNGTW